MSELSSTPKPLAQTDQPASAQTKQAVTLKSDNNLQKTDLDKDKLGKNKLGKEAKENLAKPSTNQSASQPAKQPSSAKTATSVTTISPMPNKPIEVDIVILGKVYRITCPSDEEPALQEACEHINAFVADIRDQAPHLSYEHLLVLCCLNLYEESKSNQASPALTHSEVDKAHALLDKMLKEMHTL